MAEVRTQHLFTLKLDVAAPQKIGAAPGRSLNIVPILGGTFDGERLRGTFAAGGSDWLEPRSDGSSLLNVRGVLETDDSALIAITYRGIRYTTPEVAERMQRGDAVDASEYYMRTAVFFETASEKYFWLNHIIAVAIGQRPPSGPIYNVFEVL